VISWTVFQNCATVAVVTVTVVNSGHPSDDRTIVIGLGNARNGARIDVNGSTVNIIIMAHDYVAGLLGFNQTNVTVSEGRTIVLSYLLTYLLLNYLRTYLLTCFSVPTGPEKSRKMKKEKSGPERS